jgi:hypothetical protein
VNGHPLEIRNHPVSTQGRITAPDHLPGEASAAELKGKILKFLNYQVNK